MVCVIHLPAVIWPIAKNALATALDMGHAGATILFNHYREIVTPEEAGFPLGAYLFEETYSFCDSPIN